MNASQPNANEDAAASADALADRLDARVASLRKDAEHRDDEKQTALFKQIEDALRKLMNTPFVAGDAHCQQLLDRLARSADMEQFSVRVGELDLFIRQLVASTLGEEIPTSVEALVAKAARGLTPERPTHLLDDDVEMSRMRLQVR